MNIQIFLYGTDNDVKGDGTWINLQRWWYSLKIILIILWFWLVYRSWVINHSLLCMENCTWYWKISLIWLRFRWTFPLARFFTCYQLSNLSEFEKIVSVGEITISVILALKIFCRGKKWVVVTNKVGVIFLGTSNAWTNATNGIWISIPINVKRWNIIFTDMFVPLSIHQNYIFLLWWLKF